MSASATAIAEKPGASVTSLLTQDVFLQHMQAMQTHYTASKDDKTPVKMYALPVSLLHVIPTATPASAAGKAAVTAALKLGSQNTVAFANHQKDAVNTATTKLQQNHDTASFAQQMQALEAQAQQQAYNNIHQQYQSLIQIGTAHPDQQSRILGLTNQIGAFFTNLITSVGNFFRDIATKIVGWINSAVDWIKGAAAAVATWVSGAVSSVENFFGGLF